MNPIIYFINTGHFHPRRYKTLNIIQKVSVCYTLACTLRDRFSEQMQDIVNPYSVQAAHALNRQAVMNTMVTR